MEKIKNNLIDISISTYGCRVHSINPLGDPKGDRSVGRRALLRGPATARNQQKHSQIHHGPQLQSHHPETV